VSRIVNIWNILVISTHWSLTNSWTLYFDFEACYCVENQFYFNECWSMYIYLAINISKGGEQRLPRLPPWLRPWNFEAVPRILFTFLKYIYILVCVFITVQHRNDHHF
jgi:hypothetical protein